MGRVERSVRRGASRPPTPRAPRLLFPARILRGRAQCPKNADLCTFARIAQTLPRMQGLRYTNQHFGRTDARARLGARRAVRPAHTLCAVYSPPLPPLGGKTCRSTCAAAGRPPSRGTTRRCAAVLVLCVGDSPLCRAATCDTVRPRRPRGSSFCHPTVGVRDTSSSCQEYHIERHVSRAA